DKHFSFILVNADNYEIASTMIKFFITGLAGLLIDFFTTKKLKEKLHCDKYKANSIGLVSGMIYIFFLNYNWTFDNNKNDFENAFTYYLAIIVFELIFCNLFLFLLDDKMGVNFYQAKFLSMICVFTSTCSGYYFSFY